MASTPSATAVFEMFAKAEAEFGRDDLGVEMLGKGAETFHGTRPRAVIGDQQNRAARKLGMSGKLGCTCGFADTVWTGEQKGFRCREIDGQPYHAGVDR